MINLFSSSLSLHSGTHAGVIGEAMESKLYVGNLAFSTTEEELRTMFAQAGTVKSVAIIKDRDTGRSKGFGFVEMETQAEAQNAITMFKETKLGDRILTVNLAKPREERGRGGFDRGGGGGGRGGGGGNRRDW
jgi:cold-inducible RNA-binding protein